MTSQYNSCTGSGRSHKCHKKVLDDLNIKSSGMFTSELMEGIKALKSAIIQIHVRDKNFVFLKGNKKGVRAVLFIIDDLNEIPLGVCYIL